MGGPALAGEVDPAVQGPREAAEVAVLHQHRQHGVLWAQILQLKHGARRRLQASQAERHCRGADGDERELINAVVIG